MMKFKSILTRFTAAAFLAVAVPSLVAVAAAQTGGLKGKVRNNSGQAIADATITLTKNGDEVGSARSNADGAFEIKGIEPGFYGLRVDADGYATGSLFSVEVKKGKIRDLGDKLFLRVDQGTLVILRGSVFFKEGTSVPGARVELERVNPDGTTKELGSTTTSISGEFIFRQPAGAAKYRVTAKHDGVTGSTEVSVDNAAVYRVAISLDLSGADQ
ncbi:MAG: carboxypeptidase regulatory-like domain-containing protein [Pyrinomonadaceae bacterium]